MAARYSPMTAKIAIVFGHFDWPTARGRIWFRFPAYSLDAMTLALGDQERTARNHWRLHGSGFDVITPARLRYRAIKLRDGTNLKRMNATLNTTGLPKR